jgi:hypothetical protein
MLSPRTSSELHRRTLACRRRRRPLKSRRRTHVTQPKGKKRTAKTGATTDGEKSSSKAKKVKVVAEPKKAKRVKVILKSVTPEEYLNLDEATKEMYRGEY